MAERADGDNKVSERMLRAGLYVHLPHILDEFRETLFQLFGVLRTFALSQNYEVTFHALRAIADLIAQYLTLRSGAIVMPTSLTGMLGDMAPPHDAFLVEQLESIAALHKAAIKAGDVELSREIIQSFQSLGLHSLNIRTLTESPGENIVTNLIVGYLQMATEDGAARALDDVALNGCRALGSIGAAATAGRLYLTNHIIVGGLEKIGYMGIVQRKPYVVGEAVRSIAEMTSVAVSLSLAGQDAITNALETLNRIAIQEASLRTEWLAGSLDIQTALGPFLGIGNNATLTRLEALAIRQFELADQNKDERKVTDAAYTIEELNKPLWRLFSDLGVASAKAQSFALFFVNANISAIANQQLNLHVSLQTRQDVAKSKWDLERFDKQLLHDFEWLVSVVHSRIYDAFTPPIKGIVVWGFFKSLSQIGIRCVETNLSEHAEGIIHNLIHMAKKALDVQFEGGFGPPRIAEYAARIGIIAQKRGQDAIVAAALESLRDFQRAYVERVRGDGRFEGQLIYEIENLARQWLEGGWTIDPDEAYFFTRLARGDVERFVGLLRGSLFR